MKEVNNDCEQKDKPTVVNTVNSVAITSTLLDIITQYIDTDMHDLNHSEKGNVTESYEDKTTNILEKYNEQVKVTTKSK